jgi:soluble lytic murein transglycosylase-like protein
MSVVTGRLRLFLLAVLIVGIGVAVYRVAKAAPAAPASVATAAADVIRIPAASSRLRSVVIRESQRIYGLDAPTARFAAQIHQESRWNEKAASKYAIGLTQFTPATAEWIPSVFPELRPAAPWDPEWSIRAMVLYMHHLDKQVHGASLCDDWSFSLSGYNGGPGWVSRDRRLAHQARADPDRWFGNVELYTSRADWARRENREYVRRILLLIEPEYIAAGWPGQPACPSSTVLTGFEVE